MTTLGQVARRVQYPTTGPNYTVDLCPKFKEFCENSPEAEVIYTHSDYERVRALKQNVNISINKCDVNPTFPSGLLFDHTMELVEQYLAPVLTTNIGFCETSSFNLSTGAGYVMAQKGYLKKSQAISSPVFKDLYQREDYIPAATIADKDEFLPKSDLERHKVRTIFVDPLDKLAKAKFFFDRQNKSILKHNRTNWIKYGLTKQYAGFHKFVRKLERFSLNDQSDVSGFDRSVFLYYVYYLRWKMLNLPEEFEQKFFWSVFHTIWPTCIGPDGVVFMRQTGNNSGGNNTASDNSIAHLIVLFYFLVKSYYTKFQRLINLHEILANAEFGIYSDDQLGGVEMEFFGWCSAEDYTEDKRNAYAEFGLEIKPSASLVTLGRGRLDPRHEFLGSFCHFDVVLGKYMPYPRIGKVCASLTRVGMNSDLSEEEFFERILALTFLSLPSPEVFDICVKYLQFLYSKSLHKSVLRQIMFINDLSFMRSSFISLHLGQEHL